MPNKLCGPTSSLVPGSPLYERLTGYFCRLFGCATARISVLGSLADPQLFLVLGYQRSTRDDPWQWEDGQGNRRDWDYIQEQVVASGHDCRSLVSQARRYHRLSQQSAASFMERGGWRGLLGRPHAARKLAGRV